MSEESEKLKQQLEAIQAAINAAITELNEAKTEANRVQSIISSNNALTRSNVASVKTKAVIEYLKSVNTSLLEAFNAAKDVKKGLEESKWVNQILVKDSKFTKESL